MGEGSMVVVVEKVVVPNLPRHLQMLPGVMLLPVVLPDGLLPLCRILGSQMDVLVGVWCQSCSGD